MATATDSRSDYIKEEFGSLVGKTIKTVRPLHKEECEDLAWDYEYSDEPMVIIFTDGTAVVPMRDPEGNGPGHLLLTSVEKK
jgi:hypothetical protein